jgi:predicted KAP-like P-loop ATPase
MLDGRQFEEYKVGEVELLDRAVNLREFTPHLSEEDKKLKRFLDEVELLSTQLWRKTIIWEQQPTRRTHHNHPPEGSYLD